MNFLKNTYVQGGLALLAVAWLVYYLFTSAGSAPALTAEGGTSPLSQELLLSLGKLNTITLDPAIFSDPVFISLTHFGVTIPPETAGRRNPFAPVGTPSAAPQPPAQTQEE